MANGKWANGRPLCFPFLLELVLRELQTRGKAFSLLVHVFVKRSVDEGLALFTNASTRSRRCPPSLVDPTFLQCPETFFFCFLRAGIEPVIASP